MNILREKIIQKYKSCIDNQNAFWGWKSDWIQKPYPNFEKMSDEELWNSFMKIFAGASAPMG